VSIEWEAGFAPEPIWIFEKGENLLPLPKFEPRIVYPQVPMPLNPSCRWTYVLGFCALDNAVYTCGLTGREGGKMCVFDYK
jgi:hypothetical protein